jgi:uncharacterized protein (TIGR03067 family)
MPSDLDALQGEWRITSLEINGESIPETALGDARVVITGDRFVSTGMDGPYEGTISIDPSKKPKTFDLVFTGGHAKGERNLGIYRLAGDGWTLCLATRGDVRPRTFATKPDSGFALETFARLGAASVDVAIKPATSKPTTAPAAGPATAIEGEWRMTAGVFNGKPMPDNMVEWCRRTTRGDVTTVLAGPNGMLEARFTLDRTQDPWAIDYVNLSGATKGKSQAGIARLDGDALQICMAAPGDARPDDFVSVPGDKRSYTAWTRVG